MTKEQEKMLIENNEKLNFFQTVYDKFFSGKKNTISESPDPNDDICPVAKNGEITG